jgi:hypothetical protein
VARPKLLGVAYAAKADPIRQKWLKDAKSKDADTARETKAKLKSLATLETRIRANPLAAGNGVERDRWPRDLKRDYGEIPNLFRFELAERWRGYYSLVGEPGGVRVWILYLWDHATYDKQSGYTKK